MMTLLKDGVLMYHRDTTFAWQLDKHFLDDSHAKLMKYNEMHLKKTWVSEGSCRAMLATLQDPPAV